MCDPYVAEFFFGGRTIVVEGDTEYTAFRYLISTDPSKYKDINIVRARGKACIKSLCKILNQFETNYAVLHDADRKMVVVKKTGKTKTNAMWTENGNILGVIADARNVGKVRLVASVPNFEEAFFGREVSHEKPYAAWSRLRSDSAASTIVTTLLNALIDPAEKLPAGALEWSDVDDLGAAVDAFDHKIASAPVEIPSG